MQEDTCGMEARFFGEKNANEGQGHALNPKEVYKEVLIYSSQTRISERRKTKQRNTMFFLQNGGCLTSKCTNSRKNAKCEIWEYREQG